MVLKKISIYKVDKRMLNIFKNIKNQDYSGSIMTWKKKINNEVNGNLQILAKTMFLKIWN